MSQERQDEVFYTSDEEGDPNQGQNDDGNEFDIDPEEEGADN